MRYLLLSDTHGHLDQIDELAARERADAVIHAGDFGFYDDGSVDRLESRELFLRIVHSELPGPEKTRAKKLSGDKLRTFVRESLPLSDLGRWLREGRGFRVPVYAVWGNHEDRAVLEELLAGRLAVPNLHLLHEGVSHRVGRLRLFGLGGNVVPERLGDVGVPLAGSGGKIWTTLAQIGRLVETIEALAPHEPRVFVSHVSPGREPILAWIAARLGAHVTVSGHMGSPWTVVYDEFAVRDAGESMTRIAAVPERVRATLEAMMGDSLVERARALFRTPPDEVVDRRGERLPRWYRGGFHVNLPDAPDGYAVLEDTGTGLALETRSFALRI